ncbi:MAG TPA: precorrin-2 C(20)-methyltransferase [Desulfuromonadales bacterium]|nr:precorrin-2 C(20)-methyltransferase [Desulfuromonadales bacterium]
MAVIYAVGVGPGDPELLTRKAERILLQADVVMAPVSNPTEASVALTIVDGIIDASRQEVIVHQFPMTSDKARLTVAWREAASIMVSHAEAGRNVAFITIGDPLFYSTFIYLLQILRKEHPHIPLEIVPGISSINASAAQAAAPLVEGNEAMAVVPATAGIEKIATALADFDTVVVLKVKPLFSEILELLRTHGREGSTLFVERAGSARQIVLTDFTDIAVHLPDYLSLLIIRKPERQ